MTATTTTRRFGVAVLGLLAGVLAGFGLQKAVGPIVVGITGESGPALIGTGLALSYLTPVLMVVGLLAALRVYTAGRRRSERAQ